MAKSLPYYPMYVNDFDEDPDVLDMNLAEVGLYVLCLNESWKRGSIPAEVDKLAIRIRRPVSDVHDAWTAVSGCWVPKEGDQSKLVNPRQEEERGKAETISGIRSYAAKLSHQSRAASVDANAGANAEQLQTYDSVSSSSSKILSKKDGELSPQVKWSIFQTRIKKAGVKFNFRYSEKKQAQEWLAGRDEPFDDILAAIQVFADDEYWSGEGHPWNAWVKQFDQFLDIAREGASDGPQRVDAPEKVVPFQRVETGASSGVTAKIDYPARWNELVPAKPVLWDWKRSAVDALRIVEQDVIFVDRFDEMCRLAQSKHVLCGEEASWMTFEFAIRKTDKGWGWWRILTEFPNMRPRAKYPESGQNAQNEDEERYQNWKNGKGLPRSVSEKMTWARRAVEEDMAEEEAG